MLVDIHVGDKFVVHQYDWMGDTTPIKLQTDFWEPLSIFQNYLLS